MKLNLLYESDVSETGLSVDLNGLYKDSYGVEWYPVKPVEYRIDQRTKTVYAILAVCRSAAEWWVEVYEYRISEAPGRTEVRLVQKVQLPLEDMPAERTTADIIRPGPGRAYVS